MRTTLTLDPDVERSLKLRIRERKVSFKQAVNDALRAGLGLERRAKKPPFRVQAHSSGFMPGIDPDKLNKLADELEDELHLSKILTR